MEAEWEEHWDSGEQEFADDFDVTNEHAEDIDADADVIRLEVRSSRVPHRTRVSSALAPPQAGHLSEQPPS
eukprot:1182510-Prorocentrum_minimum.AAC.2